MFYCPQDVAYSCATILPIRLVLTAMKEVTRTWKVLGGVTQASRKYKDSLFVMIAVGWSKGKTDRTDKKYCTKEYRLYLFLLHVTWLFYN